MSRKPPMYVVIWQDYDKVTKVGQIGQAIALRDKLERNGKQVEVWWNGKQIYQSKGAER